MTHSSKSAYDIHYWTCLISSRLGKLGRCLRENGNREMESMSTHSLVETVQQSCSFCIIIHIIDEEAQEYSW